MLLSSVIYALSVTDKVEQLIDKAEDENLAETYFIKRKKTLHFGVSFLICYY